MAILFQQQNMVVVSVKLILILVLEGQHGNLQQLAIIQATIRVFIVVTRRTRKRDYKHCQLYQVFFLSSKSIFLLTNSYQKTSSIFSCPPNPFFYVQILLEHIKKYIALSSKSFFYVQISPGTRQVFSLFS